MSRHDPQVCFLGHCVLPPLTFEWKKRSKTLDNGKIYARYAASFAVLRISCSKTQRAVVLRQTQTQLEHRPRIIIVPLRPKTALWMH